MTVRVAIIGTRKATDHEFDFLAGIAEKLTRAGHTVTTGGADGADHAAMVGAVRGNVKNLHVYMPWASYNTDKIPTGCNITVYDANRHEHWIESVLKYHPAPNGLTRGPLALHARNFGIVADPRVDMCIALSQTLSNWGGTGQAMRICEGEGILMYNIRHPENWRIIDEWQKNLSS